MWTEPVTAQDVETGSAGHLTRVQKLATLFLTLAGTVVTIAESKNLTVMVTLLGVIALSTLLLFWVYARLKDLTAIAGEAIKAERKCIENLHERDKLLAILYYDLKRRSGKNREPIADLEAIVGPEAAKAVQDAGKMMHMTQEIQITRPKK